MRTVRRGQGGANAIYIGRGSRWGNPFPITPTEDRDTVIERYRQHLWGQIKRGEVTIDDLLALKGHDLECFCAPLPCHGDVIILAVSWAERQRVLNEGNTQ